MIVKLPGPPERGGEQRRGGAPVDQQRVALAELPRRDLRQRQLLLRGRRQSAP